MGVKIKAGMALGGLLLSWMFGLNFLSGIASTVDSTGNILVDIADGIGLVSKASTLSIYINNELVSRQSVTLMNVSQSHRQPVVLHSSKSLPPGGTWTSEGAT